MLTMMANCDVVVVDDDDDAVPRQPREPRQPRQPRQPREPRVLLCIRMHTYECMPVWVFLCLYL